MSRKLQPDGPEFCAQSTPLSAAWLPSIVIRTYRTFVPPAVGAISFSLPPSVIRNEPCAAVVKVVPSDDVSTW